MSSVISYGVGLGRDVFHKWLMALTLTHTIGPCLLLTQATTDFDRIGTEKLARVNAAVRLLKLKIVHDNGLSCTLMQQSEQESPVWRSHICILEGGDKHYPADTSLVFAHPEKKLASPHKNCSASIPTLLRDAVTSYWPTVCKLVFALPLPLFPCRQHRWQC